MARYPTPRQVHDVGAREAWDKVVLLLAFAVGTGGGIVLKVMGFHPFVTAGYSAAVLALYALVAYFSTVLRLEPEVIGDNSYYLGFLFTLTSLSVTLYFVVSAGAEDRSRLIPEVISGFGVALVSTIVGVFIRVLMMQFRTDIVARERETRVEIDEAARRLRVDMAEAIQQMKLFGVETLQHAAERETKYAQASDRLAEQMRRSLGDIPRLFHEEVQNTLREQTTAAIDAIRASVQATSDAALRQMADAFRDIGKSAHDIAASQAAARNASEQANAALHHQVSTMTDLVGQMSRRMRSVADEVETSGDALSRSIANAAERLDASVSDSMRQTDNSPEAARPKAEERLSTNPVKGPTPRLAGATRT